MSMPASAGTISRIRCVSAVRHWSASIAATASSTQPRRSAGPAGLRWRKGGGSIGMVRQFLINVHPSTTRPHCLRRSKLQRRVVDDFLHHEEGAGLAHAGQRDELLAVDAVEMLHVADADLEEVVEVAGDEVAVEHEFQLGDRLLEDGKALRRRAVEHDADHHQRALPYLLRRDHGADGGDEAVLEQALGAAVAGGGADRDGFGEAGVTEPTAILKQSQYLTVDAVESGWHGRSFRLKALFRKKLTY